MLHGIRKLRVLQYRQSFKLFITSLIFETPQNWLIYVINRCGLGRWWICLGWHSISCKGFMWSTLVSLWWIYVGWHSISCKGFTWTTLLSIWWIYLGRYSISCKGFMWSTLVSLWWINVGWYWVSLQGIYMTNPGEPMMDFYLVDIQSLAIEAPNCVQSSYEVCTLCVLQDPVVGLLKWCKIYFKEFPYPLLKQILPQIWPIGPLGRLDLYGI
jgi:hypothetical protein